MKTLRTIHLNALIRDLKHFEGMYNNPNEAQKNVIINDLSSENIQDKDKIKGIINNLEINELDDLIFLFGLKNIFFYHYITNNDFVRYRNSILDMLDFILFKSYDPDKNFIENDYSQNPEYDFFRDDFKILNNRYEKVNSSYSLEYLDSSLILFTKKLINKLINDNVLSDYAKLLELSKDIRFKEFI